MQVQTLAVAGLGIVAAMYALFLADGLAGPSLGTALSALGLAGALAAAWGLHGLPARPARAALAGGLLALLGVRATFFAQGLDGFGLDDVGGALSVGGLLLALGNAAVWAASEDSPAERARGVRVGFGVAAVGWFATTLLMVGLGDLTAVLGLTLGAVGFSLAAPNVGNGEPAAPSAAGSA